MEVATPRHAREETARHLADLRGLTGRRVVHLHHHLGGNLEGVRHHHRELLRGGGALVGDDGVVEIHRPVVAPLVGAVLLGQSAGVLAGAAGAEIAVLRLAAPHRIVTGAVAAAQDDVEPVSAAREGVGAAHPAADVEHAGLRLGGTIVDRFPRVAVVGALLILVAVAAESPRLAHVPHGGLGAGRGEQEDDEPSHGGGNCTT